MIAKIQKSMTLRVRLTLSVVAVLSIACLAITLYMLFSARSYFTKIAVDVPMQKLVIAESAQEVGFAKEIAIEESLPPETLTASIVAANAIPVVYDSRRDFSSQSVLVMIGAIFAGALLTYFLTGKSLRPLNELNRATKSVGIKNLSERVLPVSTPDEVGELTQSFNVMMDRLEESFAIQKRFSSNAAHELKTPLATMKTSLQVLMMDVHPTYEDFAEYAKITEDCINRMISTIESLMQLTNESCQLNDSIEMRQMLDDIVAELSTKISEKNLLTTVSGDCINIQVSEPLLHRAFSNILENAIKYNRDYGKITIEIKQDDTIAQVSIRDTGFGIPNDDLPNIFEAFYRADKSRSQEIPGSGLGLAIVKVILDKHNATISVVSDKSGTCVTVRLPINCENCCQ